MASGNKIILKMYISYLFPLILLGVFVTNGKAQELDDEIEDNICTEDENMKAAIVQCISLMPNSHLEIIRNCDGRLDEIGDDHEKLLDFYCENEESFGEIDKCVSEAYLTKGMSEMEPVKPIVECMKVLFAKK